jgi:hypothetical protein
MPAQIIPTSADPFCTQTTTLDGTPYVLTFAFNARAACFYLSLATLDGEPVASGLKLVCQWNLLLKCASPLRPPGMLLVVSNTNDNSTPGLGDLVPGGRCQLVYLPAANVAALEALRTP